MLLYLVFQITLQEANAVVGSLSKWLGLRHTGETLTFDESLRYGRSLHLTFDETLDRGMGAACFFTNLLIFLPLLSRLLFCSPGLLVGSILLVGSTENRLLLFGYCSSLLSLLSLISLLCCLKSGAQCAMHLPFSTSSSCHRRPAV
jgi:hypothetical protein